MSIIAKLDEALIEVHIDSSDKKLEFIGVKYAHRYSTAELLNDYETMQSAKESMWTLELIALTRRGNWSWALPG